MKKKTNTSALLGMLLFAVATYLYMFVAPSLAYILGVVALILFIIGAIQESEKDE